MAPVPTGYDSADTVAAQITIGFTLLAFIAVNACARLSSRRNKLIRLELEACQANVRRLERLNEQWAELNADLLRSKGELRAKLKDQRRREEELVREKMEADDTLRKMEEDLRTSTCGNCVDFKRDLEIEEQLWEAREQCRQGNCRIETLQGDTEYLSGTIELCKKEIWELRDRVAEYHHRLSSVQPFVGLKDDSKPHSSQTNSKQGAKFWSAPAPELLHRL